MKFHLVEKERADIDAIYSSFENEYLHTKIPNKELRVKYKLTHREFQDLTREIKAKYGLKKRHHHGEPSYIYKCKNGYFIQKNINGKDRYLVRVPHLAVAKILVEKCKAVDWDYEQCKEICSKWREYL